MRISVASVYVDDQGKALEFYERLTAAGVTFTQPPTDVGPAVIAVFDDTCGNLIQIIAENE